MSPECSAGQHSTCPGYFMVTHPCGCPCHRDVAEGEQ